jgi:hypothetical protein
MNKNITKVTLVTAGAVLFNLLFWNEKLGLNTVLYDLFILSALFYMYPQSLRNTTVRWLVLGHLVCLAMVVYHNTALSKIALVSTIALLVPFAEYVHRNVWFAGGSMVLNMVFMMASFTETALALRNGRTRRKPISRIIRFGFFPVLILLLFFFIYSSANEAFGILVERAWEQLSIFFENFFDFFSPQRFLFFILGLFITGAILLKTRVSWFSKKDTDQSDALQRVRLPRKKRPQRPFVEAIMGRFAKGIMALKNENTTGIISLVLLNLLLAIVNIIDINYLWFNFQYSPTQPVYKMVHEGTELLIASIVLAMAILLFFFKGNLNFYRRNKWLKYGAYAWILQNLVLVASVAMRDYYYIAKQGMAYKRLGVLFFLFMVLVGLLTVAIKIANKRSGYYLWRVNAWAGVFVLVLSTTIHWDEFIAEYNLARKEKIELDVPFLLSLSDKTLPLLEKNVAVFKKIEEEHPEKIEHGKYLTFFIEHLEERRKQFFNKQEKLSWLSWNYADEYIKEYYKTGSAPSTKLNQ